jgi:hypothetical protein
MAASKDPVELYQDALRAFDAAKVRVEHLVAALKDAASKLDEWDQVKVDGANMVNASATSRVGPRSISWDQVRPGRELEQALTLWHQACGVAHTAWNNIPQPRQIGLQRPGDYCRRNK